MTRYGMVIDLDKCQQCYNCQIACKDEFVDNDWPPYSAAQPDMGQFWMHVQERERGTYPKVKVSRIPIPCMQCSNPPCLGAAPREAGYVRPDGIIIFDPAKSIGQRSMQTGCPYGVVYWNDDVGIPQKCTMCAHLLDRGWKEPRCVDGCITGAITFGDLDDANSDVAKLVATGAPQPLHPEYGAKPNVLYINIPKNFLAGSVVDKANDECFEGADVTLKDIASGKEMKTKTNNFGDFEFEGLDSDRAYSLRIEAAGYAPITMDTIALKDDTYLGDLFLTK
ncbi:4Fe-4S dicluster domain-containing protein [[Eubacterium] cellulosolvens]